MADHSSGNRSREIADQAAVKSSSKQLEESLNKFWQDAENKISMIDPEVEDFKSMSLPLARVKRVMKLDEEVKMISAEAPAVFAMACDLFIQELAIRAWSHTSETRRRTLQRTDITIATSRSDTFDFLIDVLPREEIDPKRREDAMRAGMNPEQIMQMWQQQMQEFAGQSGDPNYLNTMMQQQSAVWQQWAQMMQRGMMGGVQAQPQQQEIQEQDNHEVYHEGMHHQVEHQEHMDENGNQHQSQHIDHHLHHHQGQDHGTDHGNVEGNDQGDEHLEHGQQHMHQHQQQGY